MYRLGWTLSHPWTWSLVTFIFAVATYWKVRNGNKLLRKLSGDRLRVPGLEVVVATVLGTLLTLSIGYTGDVVGRPPEPTVPTADLNEDIADLGNGHMAWAVGLEGIVFGWVRSWPWTMAWAQTVERLGGWMSACISAMGFAAVDFLAIVSIQAEVAPSGDWSTARELAGQGIACIVSGIAGGGPVGGSLSRSMVAKMTGASSPLMGFVSGLTTIALTAHIAGVLLSPIPQAVLAAIVLAAVLPSVIHPKDLIKLGGKDAAVAWLTVAGSVLVDPMTGFIFGVAVYVLLHVRPNKADSTPAQHSTGHRTFRQAAVAVRAANRFAGAAKRSRIAPLPAHHFEHVKIDC
jgi:MFS superfamily sulfate permease-like transporter